MAYRNDACPYGGVNLFMMKKKAKKLITVCNLAYWIKVIEHHFRETSGASRPAVS
jgi:hypothetical protein